MDQRSPAGLHSGFYQVSRTHWSCNPFRMTRTIGAVRTLMMVPTAGLGGPLGGLGSEGTKWSQLKMGTPCQQQLPGEPKRSLPLHDHRHEDSRLTKATSRCGLSSRCASFEL